MPFCPPNFLEFRKLHVAQTIANSASYAALPSAADGWPIDDKVRSRQMALAFDQAQFLKKVSYFPNIQRLIDNIFRIDVGNRQMRRVVAESDDLRYPSATTTEEFHLREIQFDWMLSYKQLQAWAHLGTGELAKHIRKMYSISMGNDLLDLALNGIAEADEVKVKTDFLKLQKGWVQRIKEHTDDVRWMDGSNTAHDPIFVGKDKTLSLQNAEIAASTTSGDTTFTLPKHGLQVGMAVTIQGTDNYAGEYRIKAVDDAGNTFDITKAHTATTFAATDLLKTHPDYTSMDHLAQDFMGKSPLNSAMSWRCL